MSKMTKMKKLRMEKWPRQWDFCLDTGLSQSYISDVERRITKPSLKFRQAVATALNVEVDDLFDEEGWALWDE